MTLRVSVVIPTYKSAQWIEETLESVLRQTYPADHVEIVVVDDCSPDDSVAVATRFLEKHPDRNSKVIAHAKNQGTPANRNSGWKVASGDWIQFLDADDLLAPHKIALQAGVAEASPEDVAVVYSNWQYYEQINGKWQPSGPINAPFVDDDPVVSIINEVGFGYVGPTLIRKAYIEKVGGFIERPNIGEDTDLMLRMAMAGGKFRQARSETAAFLYRQWPSSLWRAYFKNPMALRNALLTFRGAEEFLRQRSPSRHLSPRAKHGLAERYSRWAEIFVMQDPETFADIKHWLDTLGYSKPVNMTRSLRWLSRLVGYENAVRARTAFRTRVRGLE